MNQLILNKFTPYEYSVVNRILRDLSNVDANSEKIMYIFVGANGSGKSTLIANLALQGLLKNSQYINADIYAKYKFAYIEDEHERNKTAMMFAMENVVKQLKAGKNIIYETVFSHPSKIEIVNCAQTLGYKVVACYVKTEMPEINQERVAKRVEQGGHAVPKDKIYSRWMKVSSQVEMLRSLTPNFYVFDNSQDLKVENKQQGDGMNM